MIESCSRHMGRMVEMGKIPMVMTYKKDQFLSVIMTLIGHYCSSGMTWSEAKLENVIREHWQ